MQGGRADVNAQCNSSSSAWEDNVNAGWRADAVSCWAAGS